jgi:hypothetical protein
MSSSPGEHLATLVRIRERLKALSAEANNIATAVDIEINAFADAALRSGAPRRAEPDDDEPESYGYVADSLEK